MSYLCGHVVLKPGEARRSGGDGAVYPLFDVPMYCLEAPAHSVVRHSGNRTAHGYSQDDTGGDQRYDSEYWCVLAVPLKPDNVNNSEYLDWTAMALVVQPHFTFGKQEAQSAGSGGGGTAAAAAVAAGACHADASAGILTRAWSPVVRIRISQAGDGAEGATPEHLSEPVLSAFPLSTRRSTSLGARSAHGSLHGGGGGSERRVGRGNRHIRIADLLSLFTAVAGSGGGGGGTAGNGDDPAGAPASGPPADADENGVELAGVKAMAAQAAVAATAVAVAAVVPPRPAGLTPPSPGAVAAGPSDCSTPEPQHRGQSKTDCAGGGGARSGNLSGGPT
ncbi:hypothetical protein VOLCADRAFT_85897 [Volvox carteri f. nagariensis]|uniref:Uncharacterized protein n=1 Tax=Volvox carteri f. nagariensis TaxID=3068 RepID=D8THA4_VOLCA|nr:uncharacterized protein VOLCADRAFT_85897 [Volvox carteri f. nagariensis]EFJ52676.1 hypothetical protein VOLCADRAFT_85897 [Volvox carteri f. nagariensis]|eukprot:XP_002945681.1 hypothetical protein VOLCADRAFT_85897 [Volvox carteri f. nagariensis]